MRRSLILPFLLLIAFALSSPAASAVPPPGAAAPMTAQATASAPVALTDFDVRFHAVAVDAVGQVFVAVPFPGSRVKVCKLISARLECFHDLPGSKHASVDLEILPSGNLLVTWSTRPDGAIDGPFPLLMTEISGIATPYRRAEDVLDAAVADSQSPLGKMVWNRAVNAARAVMAAQQ